MPLPPLASLSVSTLSVAMRWYVEKSAAVRIRHIFSSSTPPVPCGQPPAGEPPADCAAALDGAALSQPPATSAATMSRTENTRVVRTATEPPYVGEANRDKDSGHPTRPLPRHHKPGKSRASRTSNAACTRL